MGRRGGINLTLSRKSAGAPTIFGPIGKSDYPEQIPILETFGRQPNDTVNPPPLSVGTGMQITEEVGYQNSYEYSKKEYENDKELVEAELLLKAKREPTDCKPMTYILDGTNPQQIGRLVGRKTITFFNGSANVTIANQISGLTSNENWTLTAGDSASLDTEAEFYITAAAGTAVSIVQTYYDLDKMALALWRKKHGSSKSITDPHIGNRQILVGAK